MQIRHPHRLAREILDHLRRQPRGPGEQLDDETAKPSAPVRLENLPASAYACPDPNELCLPRIVIWRRLLYLRGSVKCLRPARIPILHLLRHGLERECKFRTLDSVPAITQVRRLI